MPRSTLYGMKKCFSAMMLFFLEVLPLARLLAQEKMNKRIRTMGELRLTLAMHKERNCQQPAS
eukprot:549073-Pleurochrysis_carterae.AAC.1